MAFPRDTRLGRKALNLPNHRGYTHTLTGVGYAPFEAGALNPDGSFGATCEVIRTV